MKIASNLLIIFTRNPVLGKCKTRLAAKVGDEVALAIYRFLLAHTHTITRNLKVVKHVYYSEFVGANDIWDKGHFEKHLQLGSNLGERMHHAFSAGFEAGFEHIILIGSDIYDLAQKDLEIAFDALDNHDAVIGPASDGGYYLLGMKKLIPAVFVNKDWGAESVFQATMNDLKTLKVAILKERNDIDRYEDIRGSPVFEPFLIDLRP